ncbi:uncharacterized protein [Drosophila tropicalis]|uniref:uncharacterized protein n=1 Tax=Drosophila tropicalis TaxID=46794 RepID=UPI0035ABBAC4
MSNLRAVRTSGRKTGVASDRSGEMKIATNLDSTGSEVVRCFVCDDPCESSTPLTEMYTMRTSTGFPNKLAQLVGEGFTIIICKEDYVCLRCTSLVNWLDRLEHNVDQVKTSLIRLLDKKYALNTDEGQTLTTVPLKRQYPSTGSGNTSTKGTTGRYFLRPRKVAKTKSDHSTTPHQSAAKVPKMCTSQRSFQCKQCSATFTQFVAMNHHMHRNHKLVMDNTSSECDVGAVKASLMKLMESNNSRDSLPNVTTNLASNATETVTRADITVHARQHPRKFICRVCDMPFSKWNLLVNHIRIHQKSKRPGDRAKVADNAPDMASAKFRQSTPNSDISQKPKRKKISDDKKVPQLAAVNKHLNDSAADCDKAWMSEVGETVVDKKKSALPTLDQTRTIEQSAGAARDERVSVELDKEIPISETDDEIKFIANESGYFLKYDNRILTDAGGNEIIVKNPDYTKKVLHRIGLIRTGEVLNSNTPESTADPTEEMTLAQDENNNIRADGVSHFIREEIL